MKLTPELKKIKKLKQMVMILNDALFEANEILKDNNLPIVTRPVDFSDSLKYVSWELFDEVLNLMRDLAEHQNGVPLLKYKKLYNETMTKVWEFLEANEI